MRTHLPVGRTALLATALVVLAEAPCVAQDDPGWQELEALDASLRARLAPDTSAGLADWSPAEVAQRAAALATHQAALAVIDPSNWSIAGKVDWLLVWSRLNAIEIEHRVTRPWQRDPLFYLDQIRTVPYVDLPLDGGDAAAWRARLEAVPAALERARAQLTEPVGELARLAEFHLDHFDGVGQGQPYRDEPPAGTIGWYTDLCSRLRAAQPEDNERCSRALVAVRGFRDWLAKRRGRMPPSAGVGTDNLNWILRRVRLLPYEVPDLLLLGEREFHRYRAAWEIVRNRNRNRELPELELTRSREQHERRTRAAERKIRELVARQHLLTVPGDAPATFETDTFWSPRALTDRHFWEELQFRNALDNHIHASIPGHRFDGLIARRVANPIRRRARDSTRAEGWATYLEEMLLLAGITDDQPRAEELFYIALMKRASRIFAETSMHAGTFTLDEANRYLIENVPFMEPDLGRYDLEGYLRRPGSGSGYILGKIQLEQLLSERSLALGDRFDLGRFHDDLLSRGMIPLTLIRWEMTGRDDQVVAIWEEAMRWREEHSG